MLGAFAALLVAAGPASADVPEGWSDPGPMSMGHLLLLIVAIPVALGVVISLLAALPGLLRGEGIAGGNSGDWLGGPRKGTAELAAPDGEASQAGGASAGW